MKTMTIIDPETGDILVGEVCTPTREAVLSERRYLQRLYSNKERKHRLIRKYKRK